MTHGCKRPRRQNNAVIRPHHPPAVVLVQLDDLAQQQLERIRHAAFLILQTSPGNHQAWVAVENGDREFASRLKRGTDADLEASGSVRVAGTFIDEGDASGLAEGDVFPRVRETLHLPSRR